MKNLFSIALISASLAEAKIVAPNFAMGTMAIYGPNWKVYNSTSADVLTEQVAGIAEMGGNQLKIRLAPETTCSGYHLECGAEVNSLKKLSMLPAVANAFAHEKFVWYQLWLYSFANLNWAKHNWTDAALEAEYEETKAWAVHMLETYSGTGKVFMAGNWEGDWTMMASSGCKKPYDLEGCDPTPEVLERMIQWGQVRQRAIDDAREEANAHNVFIYYYIEMNLGPQAVRGKPGVTNQVIPAVNPDLVSYSSYSATNAYKDTQDVEATDRNFHEVLDYVHGKLSPKNTPAMQALGFQKRMFVGEFGLHYGNTDFELNRFVTRVMSAAMRWGTPFVLYWEFYNIDESDTMAIVPRDGIDKPRSHLPLYRLFKDYYAAAKEFLDSESPSTAEFNTWSAQYFQVPSEGSCTFETGTNYDGSGYSFPASSRQECCDRCSEDPSCHVGVFHGKTCYMKFSTAGKTAGDGVACVKTTSSAVLQV